MKNAIVSGASGFIGSYLVGELRKKNVNVIELVGPGHASSCAGGNDIFSVDMAEYDRLPEILPETEDCVFYNLAWNGVYGSERGDSTLQVNNAICSEKAVTAAHSLGCRLFVEVGSIMEKEVSAVLNMDGIRPSRAYVYGEAKHLSHVLTLTKASELGIDYICPVLTNPYGEYDYSTRFINTTLKKILNNEILAFTAGNQIYDFIHIQDVARALVLLGDKGIPFHNYLIGSGKPEPLKNFIRKIGATLAPDTELLFGAVPYSGALMKSDDFNIDSLTADTGFTPSVPFEEGIVRTMNWLRKCENA